VTGVRMAQVTYLSEREHWAAYLAAPAASDMYEYGVLSSTRWRWLDERQREIVQRWLEATTPSIPGIVSQACIPCNLVGNRVQPCASAHVHSCAKETPYIA